MNLKYSHILSIVLIITSSNSFAEDKTYEKTVKGRIYTLWSDIKDCEQEGAFIISIESKGDTYKVAACSKYGCRAAIAEFGKYEHTINYKSDPLFNWISDRVFETKINGIKKRFYECSFDLS